PVEERAEGREELSAHGDVVGRAVVEARVCASEDELVLRLLVRGYEGQGGGRSAGRAGSDDDGDLRILELGDVRAEPLRLGRTVGVGEREDVALRGRERAVPRGVGAAALGSDES